MLIIGSKQAEITLLKVDHDRESNDHQVAITGVRSQLADTHDQNDEKVAKITKLETDLDSIKIVKTDLEERANNLKDELYNIKIVNTDLEERVTNLKEEFDNAVTEKDLKSERIGELAKERREYGTQIEALQKRIRELEKKDREPGKPQGGTSTPTNNTPASNPPSTNITTSAETFDYPKPGKPNFDNRPKKSIVCKNFKFGQCFYGSKCEYSHDLNPNHRPRPPPGFNESWHVPRTEKKETSKVPCRQHFPPGNGCIYAERCLFSHDPADFQRAGGDGDDKRM